MNNATGNGMPGTDSSRSSIIYVRVQDFPYDMRRLLRVQWKEFINMVEDAQLIASAGQEPGESSQVTPGCFVAPSTWAAA